MKECSIFWEKARIPTRGMPNCVKKLVDLYQVWRELQKNCKKTKDVFKRREEDFKNNLDNLFDIAHADALNMMKIEEDKMFLQNQRKPGRPGCLVGVDKKLSDKEDRVRQRKLYEENKMLMSQGTASTSSASDFILMPSEESSDDDQSEISLPTTSRAAELSVKRGRKDIITPKLVAALDRCQLSIRDSVYILQATIEALGLSSDAYPINKSSIQRLRTQARKERAEAIKIDFQDNIPEVVTVHWDGKLLPSLDVRSSKEERLPILITFDRGEQLLAVPKLDNSSGKNQAQAVFNALQDWGLTDKVQIMCCDTTASNTGRFNGACALLEQMLERELLLFACRHHVYELVLKSVFEAKIPQVTSSPDIPLFKKFKDNWKNINSCDNQLCTDFVQQHTKATDIQELVSFYRSKLLETTVRDDYREMVELSIIFLGKDEDKVFKIRPPGYDG